MKHAGRKVGASLVVASALVLCVGVGSAFAGAQDTAGKDTNWTVPTQAMTNTVEKDGTTYKVITTWANAWATGGPDYLGISNSCYLATQGGGTSSAESLEYAQKSTLLGIWASVANENPNAYNWNTFYNLYVDTDEGIGAQAEAADFETTSNSWNSKTGVWGAFDFRPEIIWTSNGLSQSQVGTYVGYINVGQYFSGTDTENGESGTPGTDDYTAPEKTNYYIDGDESYDPYIISANNQNAYSYTDTFYNLAGFVDEIVADYSGYDGTSDPQTDWKGMNSLPRTTRYETVGLSAQDCALNIERVTRGSIYYVLEQLATDPTLSKKKVAYLESAPNTSSSSVTVIAYDYIENVGQGPNNGYASYSPTIVDQLITDQNVTQKVIANEDTVGANSSSYNNPAKGSALYGTESTATADDLLDCDIIYVPNGSMTSSQVSEWLSDQATSDDKESKLANVSISAYAPAIMQWSNFTAEKMVYGTYAVNFFYPELFPNMELVGYWYDEVYHMNEDAISTAMGYTFGNADLPADTSLESLGDNYSKDEMEGKFAEGLKYYVDNFETDATISRILTGKALPEGVTTQSLTFNGFNPSNEFLLSVLEPTDVVEYLSEYGDFVNSNIRDTKNDEIDALEQAVKDLEDELEAADTDLENANGEIAGLTDDLEQAKKDLEDLQASDNAKQSEIDRLAKEIEDLNKQLEEAKKGSTAGSGSGTGTGSKAAAQKITAKKSVTAKKGKKATIKVSGAKTALKVTAKGKAKKALKVTVKKGKIVVKAKKKGTYKVQVYAAASSSYAKSNTVTVKVKVK